MSSTKLFKPTLTSLGFLCIGSISDHFVTQIRNLGANLDSGNAVVNTIITKRIKRIFKSTKYICLLFLFDFYREP